MEFDYIQRGDCLELLKGIENKSVDTVFTSPPYNRKRNDKYAFYEDTIDDYFSFLCKFTDDSLRVAKDHTIVNIQKNYYNKSDVFKYIGKYAYEIVEIIVWEKQNPMPASGFNITNAYEFFIIMGNKNLKSNTTYTKNVITTSVNDETSEQHGAVMKKEVADWFIKNFTKESDIVLDPFLGTGTTAVSCIEQNRHYIGFEISEKYLEMADERIEKAKRSRDFNTLPIGGGYEQLKLF